ncbi:MAG: hypothetical protein JNN15_16860, partial [Blastocatellia bacterium]|nr:hypothetical protein [Blastocatellia bacterium]
MVKRILAIVAIFIFTSIAWAILGGTIFSRTYSLNKSLEGKVASNWGTSHTQSPPSAFTETVTPKIVEETVDGKKVTKTVEERTVNNLKLESSRIAVDLKLEHRQKGLLWYSTYKVKFAGSYLFKNSTDINLVSFSFYFPTSQAIYDDLLFTVNGEAVEISNQQNSISATSAIAPGETAK